MRPTHWIIVILVVILIFGASKLPDIARSIGQSAKILKKEMRELQDEPPAAGNAAAAPTVQAQQAPPAAPAAAPPVAQPAAPPAAPPTAQPAAPPTAQPAAPPTAPPLPASPPVDAAGESATSPASEAGPSGT